MVEIFEKGNFKPVGAEFRTLGLLALEDLNEFQNKFEIYDTDTTINQIRDAIIANYLSFDLLNYDKHGFDAKNSESGCFLEIKQCSISSRRLGGTWNDTNLEKAAAFSDPRLFTVVAIWKGASELKFMVYGQDKNLGEYLKERIINRKINSRSTQNIGISDLVMKYNFTIICPPAKSPSAVLTLIANYNLKLSQYIQDHGKIRTL